MVLNCKTINQSIQKVFDEKRYVLWMTYEKSNTSQSLMTLNVV